MQNGKYPCPCSKVPMPPANYYLLAAQQEPNKKPFNEKFRFISSEKPANGTDAFSLKICSLADLYYLFFQGLFWIWNESGMNPRFPAESGKGILWEPMVFESERSLSEGCGLVRVQHRCRCCHVVENEGPEMSDLLAVPADFAFKR